jgi:hypothetical protein
MEMKKSRVGRHKEGNVLLGAMVEPRKKAIAIVTAAVVAGTGKPLTQTEIIWEGISRLAKSYGIIDENGKVTPQFADAVTLATESVVMCNRSNLGSRGGKRGAK